MITNKPDRELDVKGLTCPMPTLETKQVIKTMKEGEILRIECDSKPAAETTMPQFFKRGKLEFEVEQKEDSLWVFYVRV
tara:strand:- start:584 stop:820 length:237 start_codon:yes stop_codon:yes gene_type:complete